MMLDDQILQWISTDCRAARQSPISLHPEWFILSEEPHAHGGETLLLMTFATQLYHIFTYATNINVVSVIITLLFVPKMLQKMSKIWNAQIFIIKSDWFNKISKSANRNYNSKYI